MIRRRLIEYTLAIAALIAAVILRWLLDPVMGDTLPLVTLFAAVAMAVWVGGYRPAILVALLGYLACHLLFIEPRGHFHFDNAKTIVGLTAYAFTCTVIIWFGEAMRLAQVRANQGRELLWVTLRSIGDAVITTDVVGRVTTMNAVAESLTGWSQEAARGQPLETVFRIVNESTRQPVDSPVNKVLRDGVIVGLANHTVLIQKDGGERPIDDSAAPIRNDHGEVTGCVLTFRDVTAQRRFEQEKASQLQSARLLAAIVESSDDAIISKTLNGIIQSWNAGAERIFGFTAEEAVGKHVSLVIPKDRISEEDQIIARLKVGERIEHFETERVRSDGRRIHVSLTISPIKDNAGQVIGASKIVRDISGKRQAEERERLLMAETAFANAKFRALFDQGAIFAGIVARDGTLLEANRLSWEACGFTREQVIGKPFWEGPWWSPSAELVAQIKAASEQAAEGVPFRAELPYYIADGIQRTVDFSIQPIIDDSGKVLFLAPTGADITDRRQMQDNLRRLAADLADDDRRKDEFLATLAHELRNPLAPIRNALQILRLTSDPEPREHAHELMERQLEHMVRLVDDLMDVSRITRGKLELRRENVPLADVINGAVETSRPLIQQMDHELTVTLPPHPIYVNADLTRLAQVFSNLLNNSAKYMDRGGHIWLTVEHQANEVIIAVKDTGIGIAAEQLPRIFEMFSQLDQAIDRSQGGLGIGLTLVKRLVEMHGGRIEARSAGVGSGAEFLVRLPIVVGAAEPHDVSMDRDASPKSSLRILVVDDNRDGADSLVMLLQLMGNDTRTAYDGQQGVEAAEEFRPDVILLDIGLPKLNGYEACRRIREQPWAKKILMIAVTGWGQDNDRKNSREAGFDHHLVKPVDPQELMKLLSNWR